MPRSKNTYIHIHNILSSYSHCPWKDLACDRLFILSTLLYSNVSTPSLASNYFWLKNERVHSKPCPLIAFYAHLSFESLDMGGSFLLLHFDCKAQETKHLKYILNAPCHSLWDIVSNHNINSWAAATSLENEINHNSVTPSLCSSPKGRNPQCKPKTASWCWPVVLLRCTHLGAPHRARGWLMWHQ